jgi:hypothetical protein
LDRVENVMMPIPDQVRESVLALLEQLDAALPGPIEAAYLTGSVALDDFQPDISDIDAVFVTDRLLDEPDFEALSRIHQPSRPHIDVLYVTADELLSDPAEARGPHSHEGTFASSGAFAANPVEWRTLQTRALTIRGPDLTPQDVWFDPGILRAWNARNLRDYWVGRLGWLRGCEPTEAIMRWEYGLQWLVLGVPRLHHTIATLDITSKTGAGRYALETVDHRWHPVIESCIALRQDRSTPLTLHPDRLRRDAVDLVTWLIDDAQRTAGRG